MRAGTLSDDKIVKTLNESFISIHVDLTDGSNMEAGKIFRKYATQGLIPQLVFLTPDGKQKRELQHIGDLPVEKLLGKLEELKGGSEWFKDLNEAIAKGKKTIRPILSFRKQKGNEEAKKLFKKLVNGLMKAGVTDKVVLHKEHVEAGEKHEVFVTLMDPLKKTEEAPTTVVYGDKGGTLEESLKEIQAFVDGFRAKYVAEGQYACASCGEVSKEPKECCGAQMDPALTFKCDSCGQYSSERKECCGGLMGPVTR